MPRSGNISCMSTQDYVADGDLADTLALDSVNKGKNISRWSFLYAEEFWFYTLSRRVASFIYYIVYNYPAARGHMIRLYLERLVLKSKKLHAPGSRNCLTSHSEYWYSALVLEYILFMRLVNSYYLKFVHVKEPPRDLHGTVFPI